MNTPWDEARHDASKRTILVGLSGGIVSAIAAALLKKQGFKVRAVHYYFSKQPPAPALCAQPKKKIVENFAKQLDVPVEYVPIDDVFEEEVVDYFIHARLQGNTNNACMRCLKRVFLRALFLDAQRLRIESIATGLFAQSRIEPGSLLVQIHQALEVTLDQSFLLVGFSQEELQKMIFPVGLLTEARLLKVAKELDVKTASLTSKAVNCFAKHSILQPLLQERVFKKFTTQGVFRVHQEGPLGGSVYGNHNGLPYYVYGSDEGIDQAKDDENHYYVTNFDLRSNMVILGPYESLIANKFICHSVQWVYPLQVIGVFKCHITTEHTRAFLHASVLFFAAHRCKIFLEDPVTGIYPGHQIIFYANTQVLGGAVVEKYLKAPCLAD